ncbi:MAG: ABC transporter ATP-binding protein [Candidatus Eremiobacteraeota bacterium]|nr:ABC transporter ATP-binding protein [Candidatus Eremiobacteraeota bacterium]
MSGSSIQFKNVSARYPDADRNAVSDINLDVRAGEFITLVGPSGCGKTTLLRTVNRLTPLTGGSILLDGTDIATLDAIQVRRSIGYAIQATGLFPHMTVAQNIAVVPSLLEWPRAEIDARVNEMLELVRLDPDRYRNRRPRELSGGEAQRVGVARALAARPRALLMDEPFGALDAIVRRKLQVELIQIVRDTGSTTIFVTHDVNESLHLADRVVVLNAGHIEQIARPAEILRAPATPFVAELFAPDETIERLRSDASRS